MPRSRAGFVLPLTLRFFFATALLIALAVGAAVFVTYTQGQRIADQAVAKALTTSAAVQREFEQRRLEQLQLNIRLIAADASFVKYIADATGADTLPGLGGEAAPDVGSMRDLLEERQRDFGFDFGILLDGKGDVLARTDQIENFSESLATDAFIAPAIRDAAPFSDYWYRDGKLFQAAIMPLAQDQNLVGFLLIALAVDDELSRKVAQVSGAQIAFWLPHDDRLELAASSLDASAVADLQQAFAAQRAELVPVITAGKTLERVSLHFGGQDWVAKLAPTAAPGIGKLGAVMALASADQIIASYGAILNWVLLAGLASMVAALLLSFLISKGILRPVRTMAKAAEDAAAGNYRTHIGIEGEDELARLARAFDTLLSELREKSDMEGYVGNLARFLPEPGQEGHALAVYKPPTTSTSVPKRAALTLLGLEFRHLLTLPADLPPEQVLGARQRVHQWLESLTQTHRGNVRSTGGARWLLVFAGEARRCNVLMAWRALGDLCQGNGVQLPAAALADGDLVDLGESRELIGATLVQIDRLLCDAAIGQVLVARSAGETLKANFGDDVVAVAVGGFSGKQFYALTQAVLAKLPTVTSTPSSTEDVTVFRNLAETPLRPARSGRDPQLAPGATLGERYRILSVLGAGGMGMVYKAHDLELDDVVALKMLKPGVVADVEQLDRLKSEIKLARRITHPNVLRTFDFGDLDGFPYISMEYVRGLTLRYLLREAKRVPYSAGLRIARQLAAGLAAAHEGGVLHRDIKPENLILEANGNAKLMDFGIARPTRRAEPGHTLPGTFLGTPNYCAPEQLAGEEIDERADIYACGVLMTEMFCGGLPYTGSNTMEIYMAQMHQDPTKPSTLWPDIRLELEALILRCLQRQPQERFSDATELAAALSQLRA